MNPYFDRKHTIHLSAFRMKIQNTTPKIRLGFGIIGILTLAFAGGVQANWEKNYFADSFDQAYNAPNFMSSTNAGYGKFASVGGLAFSADGKSFAFSTSDERLKFSLFRDGKNIGEGTSPTYSPDGKSFAYVMKKNGKNLVVRDGKEIAE